MPLGDHFSTKGIFVLCVSDKALEIKVGVVDGNVADQRPSQRDGRDHAVAHGDPIRHLGGLPDHCSVCIR